jgi:hypothetical protein
MSEEATEATEAPSEQFVSIPEASDADLESFLSNAQTSEAQAETEQPEEQPAEQQTQQESQPETVTMSKQELETMQQEIAQRNERIKQQELFIQRRNTELGSMQKQLIQQREQLAKGLDERFLESPSKALQDQKKIQEIDENLQAVEQERVAIETVQRSKEVVSHYVKPEHFNLDGMVDCLRSDGVDEGFVTNFSQNPFLHMAPEGIVHLAQRHRAEAAFKVLFEYSKKLFQENAQLKNKPQRVLQGVQKALKQTPTLTASTGSSTAQATGPKGDPSKWSDAEIEGFLKNSK